MKPESMMTRRSVIQSIVAIPFIASPLLTRLAPVAAAESIPLNLPAEPAEFLLENDYPYFGWNPDDSLPRS